MKSFPTDPLPSPSEIADLHIHDVEFRPTSPIELLEDEIHQDLLQICEITGEFDRTDQLDSEPTVLPPTNLTVDPNTGEFVFTQSPESHRQTSMRDNSN
ncbi:MAG: hypothetical protein L7U72_01960 [Rubripirellula sp.]|nr:hypothetical protein [Rubripirellula sp.]